jgi:hypothetical protein
LKAFVYLDDTLICEAVPKPVYNRAKIERTPADEAAREVMSAYVATIEAYMRRKAASIGSVVVIDNTEKTLNKKFAMPNISRFEAKEDGPVEILDTPEDDEVITTPNTGFVRSLKDRF